MQNNERPTKSAADKGRSSVSQNLGEVATYSARNRRPNRKSMQLCAQVRYALEYAISAALKGDYGITVLDVLPAPDTSHLLVLVQIIEQATLETCAEVQRQLTEHSNTLRSAVAQSIYRRKTPGLSFQVVPRIES